MDTLLTVHEVNIGESVIDATIKIKTEWIDDRFRFGEFEDDPSSNFTADYGFPNKFGSWTKRVGLDDYWNPNIYIKNHITGSTEREDNNDYAFIDYQFGAVTYEQTFRTKVNFKPVVSNYPYDIQEQGCFYLL